jgi:hypothetical protein
MRWLYGQKQKNNIPDATLFLPKARSSKFTEMQYISPASFRGHKIAMLVQFPRSQRRDNKQALYQISEPLCCDYQHTSA